jgi:hypothetical protein
MSASPNHVGRARLRAWVLSRAGHDLADDTPIFESGALSSLEVVELIAFVETLRGEPLDLDTVDPEALTSIDTIARTFLGD